MMIWCIAALALTEAAATPHRHCRPTSASSRHMQSKLKIANGCQARYHRSWCAGAAMHGHGTGVRKLRMEPAAWPHEKAKEPSNGRE